MECEAGRSNKTSNPKGNFMVTLSLEGWPTKAKEAPSTCWTPTQYFNVVRTKKSFDEFEENEGFLKI